MLSQWGGNELYQSTKFFFFFKKKVLAKVYCESHRGLSVGLQNCLRRKKKKEAIEFVSRMFAEEHPLNS
jgi:hypothetical protein